MAEEYVNIKSTGEQIDSAVNAALNVLPLDMGSKLPVLDGEVQGFLYINTPKAFPGTYQFPEGNVPYLFSQAVPGEAQIGVYFDNGATTMRLSSKSFDIKQGVNSVASRNNKISFNSQFGFSFGAIDTQSSVVNFNQLSLTNIRDAAGATDAVNLGVMQTKITEAVGVVAEQIETHIGQDAELYTKLVEYIVSLVVKQVDPAEPTYDMSSPNTLVNIGGLGNSSTTFTAPSNGLLQVVYKSTLLGSSPRITQNGVEIMGSSTTILNLGSGKPIGFTLATGDVIVISGTIGLLDSFNATFYPQV